MEERKDSGQSAGETAQRFMDGVYVDAIEEEYRESRARKDGYGEDSCDGGLSSKEICIDEQGSSKSKEDRSVSQLAQDGHGEESQSKVGVAKGVSEFLGMIYDEVNDSLLKVNDEEENRDRDDDEFEKCEQVHFESDSDNEQNGDNQESQKAMSELAPNHLSVVTDGDDGRRMLHKSIGPNSTESKRTIVNSLQNKQMSQDILKENGNSIQSNQITVSAMEKPNLIQQCTDPSEDKINNDSQ